MSYYGGGGDYWYFGNAQYFGGGGSGFYDGDEYNFSDFSGDLLGLVVLNPDGSCPAGTYRDGDACLQVIGNVSTVPNGLDYCVQNPTQCLAYIPGGGAGAGGANYAVLYAPSPQGNCGSVQAAALSAMNQAFNKFNSPNTEGLSYVYPPVYSGGPYQYTPPVSLTVDPTTGVASQGAIPQPPDMSSTYKPAAIAHTHGDPASGPSSGIDVTTGQYFSIADMQGAVYLQVPIYVMVNVASTSSGSLTINTEAFVWTPASMSSQPTGWNTIGGSTVPSGTQSSPLSGVNPGSTPC